MNLDSWAPEQVVCLQQMGNSRARAVYEALLSDNFRRPQTDSGLESFIRAKYEQKKYIAREWIPPPFPPKVDWDKEINEELENQKRKKKTASCASTVIQEPPKSNSSSTANVIPAPLPKPKNSPKGSRLSTTSFFSDASKKNNTADLLGLDTSSLSSTNTIIASTDVASKETLLTETFDFLAESFAVPPISQAPPEKETVQLNNELGISNQNDNSLKKEEDDFFSQKSIDNNGLEKGRLTKDNILALYGKPLSTASSFQSNLIGQSPQTIPFNANFPNDSSAGVLFGGNLFNNKQQPVALSHSQQQQKHQYFNPGGESHNHSVFNNGNNGNFIGNVGFSTIQSQQINRMNEENIRKIESLNFNNFK